MATLNLGRIKPVFRGAYAGGTAYVVDDIVTSGNETFICIQASTGNATSNASYWTKLAAKGTDGTDGTDVGTTITTQGDILYRDGSGLQRLAKGTAGQALKMNSGATAPEWGTISSDFVKVGTVETTTDVASVDIQGCFSTDYDFYTIKFGMLNGSGNYWFEPAWLDSSNAVDTTTMQHKHYEIYGDATSLNNTTNRQADTDGWRIMNTWYQNDNYFWAGGSIDVYDPLLTHMPRHMWYDEMTWSYGDGGGSHIGKDWGMGYQSSTTAHHGIRFRMNGGNIKAGFRATVYGMKN